MRTRALCFVMIAASGTGCVTVYEQAAAGGASTTNPAASGGASATGGASNTGGASSTGGTAIGGTSGTGDTLVVGGSSGLGGALSTVAGSSTLPAGGATTVASTTASASGGANTSGGSLSTGGTSVAASSVGGATAVQTGQTLGGASSTGGAFGSATGGAFGSATGGAFVTGGSATGGSATSMTGCVAQTTAVQLPQVNFLFLLDKSGSMGTQKNGNGGFTFDNCDTRWNPMGDAVKAFITDASSSRLHASLSFMPADGDEYSMCTTSSYTTGTLSMKVPLTALDDAGRQMFTSRLCDCGGDTALATSCVIPNGGTPTLPALQGTFSYADSLRHDKPGSTTVIVFLSDGEPGFGFSYDLTVKHLYSCNDLPPKGCAGAACGCVENDQCVDVDEEVAKVAAVIQSAPARSVYVAGMGDISPTTLDTWATASGNNAIDLLNMSGTEAATTLLARLNAIRSATTQCGVDLPAPTSGTSLDADKMGVNYVSGSGSLNALTRTSDGTANSCSGSNGWYFDNPRQPKQVMVCPATCASLQQDAKAQLQIVYGC